MSSGDPACPCLASWGDYPHRHSSDGIIVTLGSVDYTYDFTYGLGSCGAWDELKPPYCNEGETPEWCFDEWCFVDGDSCTGVPIADSSGLFDVERWYEAPVNEARPASDANPVVYRFVLRRRAGQPPLPSHPSSADPGLGAAGGRGRRSAAGPPSDEERAYSQFKAAEQKRALKEAKKRHEGHARIPEAEYRRRFEAHKARALL